MAILDSFIQSPTYPIVFVLVQRVYLPLSSFILFFLVYVRWPVAIHFFTVSVMFTVLLIAQTHTHTPVRLFLSIVLLLFAKYSINGINSLIIDEMALTDLSFHHHRWNGKHAFRTDLSLLCVLIG